MALDYDVRAKLTLDGKAAKGQLKQAGKDAKVLKQNLQGATDAASGLWTKVLAVGGAYVGLNSAISVISRLTTGAVGYTAALEKSSIGLTSVISAVEGISWDKAAARAGLAFEEIKDLAVKSPASPQELFGIFQGIAGPIEAAGFGLQKVLDITEATVSAASALDIDFQQAQRDITMMVRGAAGMEVKLFSMLRSTGAIAESTEEWNQKLTAQERVTKLTEALDKFKSAGDKYGHSWSGVTSTFHGIVQEFGRAGISPVMDAISGRLDTFNSYLIANQDQITETISSVGHTAAVAISNVFDKAQTGFTWTVNHWGEITDRFESLVSSIQRLAPVLAGLGLANAALGGNALGVAYSVFGGGGGGDSGGGIDGMSDDEMSEAGYRKNKRGRWVDSAGKFAAGGAATAAGGASASGAAATVSALAGPLTLALFAMASVAAFASDHLQVFSEIWHQATDGMGSELMGLWQAIKDAVLPLLKNWGGVIAALLVPAFQLLVFVFRLVVKGLTLLIEAAGMVYSWIYSKLSPAFEMMVELFDVFGEALQKLGRVLGLEVDRVQNLAKGPDPEAAKYEGGFDAWLKEHQGFGGSRIAPMLDRQQELMRVPSGRSSVVNDFRGSKITIKQDFKGKHDPDRIVQAMMLDLTRQAEFRVTGGGNPLSR